MNYFKTFYLSFNIIHFTYRINTFVQIFLIFVFLLDLIFLHILSYNNFKQNVAIKNSIQTNGT